MRGGAWALAAAVLFSACAGRPGSPDQVGISVPFGIESLDPHQRDLLGQLAVAQHIFEPLVAKDRDLALVPRLAERWSNPDPLTWRFELKAGVRFHDGRPFGAEDVVFTLRRLLAREDLQVGIYVADVTSVKATGPLAVELTTRAPDAILLHKLTAVAIVPRGATDEELRRRPVGTGPWRFVARGADGSLSLARYEEYRGTRPAFARATLRLERGAEESLKDLSSGASQVAWCGSRTAERLLARRPEIRMTRRTGLFLVYLGFDLGPGADGPLARRAVREAISLALDRTALAAGRAAPAVPAAELVPPSVFGYDASRSLPRPDPLRAKALLREAGFPEGFSCTMDARALLAGAGTAVARMLAPIGVTVTVSEHSEEEFFRLAPRHPAFFLTRFGCDTGDASDLLLAVLHTPDTVRHFGSANAGRFSDPALDRGIEESLAIQEPTTRRARLIELLRRAEGEIPAIPLFFDEDVWAAHEGFRYSPRADSWVLAQEVERS